MLLFIRLLFYALRGFLCRFFFLVSTWLIDVKSITWFRHLKTLGLVRFLRNFPMMFWAACNGLRFDDYSCVKRGFWWAILDLNQWPLRCQRSALANWANRPIVRAYPNGDFSWRPISLPLYSFSRRIKANTAHYTTNTKNQYPSRQSIRTIT